MLQGNKMSFSEEKNVSCCSFMIMWILMEDATQLIMKRPCILSQTEINTVLRAASRYVDHVIIAETSTQRKLYCRWRLKENMRHFFSLSPPGRGRMVRVRDGVSATHSLSICVSARSQILEIVKLCHSPVWFSCHQGLFRFPEVGGGLHICLCNLPP